MSGVENGKSKRRDYKRENFPGLTVSYRGLVEYQAEIGFRMADPGQTSLSLPVPRPSSSHRDLPLRPCFFSASFSLILRVTVSFHEQHTCEPCLRIYTVRGKCRNGERRKEKFQSRAYASIVERHLPDTWVYTYDNVHECLCINVRCT